MTQLARLDLDGIQVTDEGLECVQGLVRGVRDAEDRKEWVTGHAGESESGVWLMPTDESTVVDHRRDIRLSFGTDRRIR